MMLLRSLVLVIIGVGSSIPGELLYPKSLRPGLMGIFARRLEHEPGGGGCPYIGSQINCGSYSRTIIIEFPVVPVRMSVSGG